MSYARNKRKKMKRRKREFPQMFRAGVPIGSFNMSKRENHSAEQAQRYFSDEEFLASFS